MAVLVCLVLVLAMAARSSASYCLCKDGIGDAALQKVLDYACGNGANCQLVQPNGACYTQAIKPRCDFAANSYYQAKASLGATCDFGGACTPSQTPPAGTGSGCVSSSGTGTPTSGTNGTRTPTTGNPVTGSPALGTPTTGTPTAGGGITTPTTGGGITTPTTGGGITTPTTGGGGTATGSPTTGAGMGTGSTGTGTTGTGSPTLTPTTGGTPFGLAPTAGITTDSSAGGLRRNPGWFTSLGVVVVVPLLLYNGLVLPPFWG